MSVPTSKTANLKPAALQPAAPHRHLGWLDSLRALAALYVVLHHIALLSLPDMGRLHGIGLLLVGPFRYGEWAVDLFIVLSGFCLMLPVARGGGTLRGGTLRFFVKRARRILPPYYAALALSVLAWLVIGHSVKVQWNDTPLVSVAGILPATVMLQDVFPQDFDPALWSVAVEWKIYFLFPLLVLLWRRIGPLPTTFFSLLVAIGLQMGLRQSIWVRVTPEYLALFTFGMLAASAVFRGPGIIEIEMPTARPRISPAPSAAVLLGAAFVLNHKWRTDITTDHQFLINLLAGAGMAYAMTALGQAKTGAFRRLLSWRGLVFVGTYAYSIYLIHMPIVVILSHYVVQPLHLQPMISYVLLVCLGIPTVLGFTYLFFLACERPFLNTKRHETPAETARDAALSPAP